MPFPTTGGGPPRSLLSFLSVCGSLRNSPSLRPFSFSLSSTLFPRYCTAAETRSQKLERIADELLDLNKLERYDYAILFSHKLGLNRWAPAGATLATAPSAVAGAEGTKGAAAQVEKSTFNIKLEKFDTAAKIKVIKEVRGFTDLGLKEAKDLVEKAPVVVKKQVAKEEAEQIATKLKELGATVVLE